MKYTSYDDFFTVLSNKQRVKILQYLNQEGPKNVSEISQKLKIEQSAVSHALRRLMLCHFVDVRQQGKERIYEINNKTIHPLFTLIEEHVKAYCVKGCIHWE